ncbi:hypothetical protein F5Y16DRAFT_209744 [Xylariaceae sp. FL0255]|nr:hypothetical protein F5Y16DRAFT_209744 [Xylariaceae sp. FL0255]
MSWATFLQTAGSLALSPLKLLGSLLYILSTPLRWFLYNLYAVIAFLFSPALFMINLGIGTVSYTVDLVIRLKYIYIYLACAAFIGLCAGALLHGTSSFIFILLGVDTASQHKKQRAELYHRQLQSLSLSADEYDSDNNNNNDNDGFDFDYNNDENEDELELDFSLAEREASSLSTTRLGSSSSPSGASTGWRRWGGSASGGRNRKKQPEDDARLDPVDLFEKRWRQLRAGSESNNRRRRGSKGLLSQTIHEESSESDFT